jgi:hypothetical protein
MESDPAAAAQVGGGGDSGLEKEVVVKEISFPKSCASIGVHGHGLKKMTGFPATGEPCGSSSGMAGNKDR